MIESSKPHKWQHKMPLVDYPGTDSSGEEEDSTFGEQKNEIAGRKRKWSAAGTGASLPPLPDSFHDLYASTSRTSNQDDPELHAGRQRQTPHVEGNWPTHIYLECEFTFSS